MKRRWVLIIILLLILIIALAGALTLLWRFFIFISAVLLLSYIWSRLTARGIQCHVEKLPRFFQVGERFEMAFTLTNRSTIPTPLIELQEDTDLPGYLNKLSVSLSSRGSYSWRTEVYCQRRGRYGAGVLKMRVTDPLGFFPVERRIGEHQEITVYPATLDLPLFERTPRRGKGIGSTRWLDSETSPNASSVREYISGDSLRHIHWHTTAHTGNLMVREFDPDRTGYGYNEIWLVLDMRRASQLGEGNETTEEYGVTIAASLAKKYLSAGKKVGLIAAGDRSFLLTPEAGEERLQHILHSLALLKATGEVPINDLLASRAEHFGAGSIVIIIMPSANPGIAAPLRYAIDRRARVIAILLDSFSFGGVNTPANNVRSLNSSGINAYVVRQGMDIPRALDSQLDPSRLQYVRGKSYVER
jgi:uncharacterized protein (DUF58 family)